MLNVVVKSLFVGIVVFVTAAQAYQGAAPAPAEKSFQSMK